MVHWLAMQAVSDAVYHRHIRAPLELTLLGGVKVGLHRVQHDQVALQGWWQLPLTCSLHACRQAVKLRRGRLAAVPDLHNMKNTDTRASSADTPHKNTP